MCAGAVSAMRKVSATATARMSRTPGRRRTMARALSEGMAMAAVASASASMHEGATTVAESTSEATVRPVAGLMMWAARVPSRSVRELR